MQDYRCNTEGWDCLRRCRVEEKVGGREGGREREEEEEEEEEEGRRKEEMEDKRERVGTR